MQREHFSFRMPKELKERMKEAAKAERRTPSNMAERIIQLWLDEHYPEKAEAGQTHDQPGKNQ